MALLHLSKVAVGCGELAELTARTTARTSGDECAIVTRYRPTRHGEVTGGALFWIIRHRLVARQTILGFAEAEGGRTAIRLDARLIAVTPRPRRAHQGWRYLSAEDAPADLIAADCGLSGLPPELLGALAELALV